MLSSHERLFTAEKAFPVLKNSTGLCTEHILNIKQDNYNDDSVDREESEETVESPRQSVTEIDGVPLIKGPWTPPVSSS